MLADTRGVLKSGRRAGPHFLKRLLVVLTVVCCVLAWAQALRAFLLHRYTDNTHRPIESNGGRTHQSADNGFGILAEISPARELIVTATTCGYLDMTLNWIAQLASIGAHNFLVIAEDLPAYEYLLRVIPRQTLPSHVFGRPFSRTARPAARFDSKDFDWCSRPFYLRQLIRQNVRAVWIDSDAMLLKNPYEVVTSTSSSSDEVVLVDDEPVLQPITKYSHYYCSCFVMVRPSKAANAFLSTWAQLCANRTQDQPPLNEALDLLDGVVSFTRLPKPVYPSGYDAERLTLLRRPGWEAPAWVHANWREGVLAKEQFLSRFGLWRNIRAHLQCKT